MPVARLTTQQSGQGLFTFLKGPQILIVIGHYFCLYFLSIFNPTSLHIPYPTFLLHVYLCYVYLLMPFMLMNKMTRTQFDCTTGHQTTCLLGYQHPETVLLWFLLTRILRQNLLCCHRMLPPLKVLDFPDTCHQTIFLLVFFCPFLIQLHFTFLDPPFSFMFIFIIFPPYAFTLTNRRQEHDLIVQLVTKQLVYWTTNILKQSCCGSPSPGSCTGTSSATTEHSHHSKFQTSRIQSTSRSASTA